MGSGHEENYIDVADISIDVAPQVFLAIERLRRSASMFLRSAQSRMNAKHMCRASELNERAAVPSQTGSLFLPSVCMYNSIQGSSLKLSCHVSCLGVGEGAALLCSDFRGSIW